jgi:hypothetical protein
LRASHADREQVIGTLKAAFVAGVLAKDEFDLRVGQAFASRTYADLATLTADLPAGLAVIQPPKPARTQDQIMQRPGRMMAVATALYAGVWAFTFLPPWPTNGEGDPPGAVLALFFSSPPSTCWFVHRCGERGRQVAGEALRRAATAAPGTWRGRSGIPAPASSRPGLAAPAR